MRGLFPALLLCALLLSACGQGSGEESGAPPEPSSSSASSEAAEPSPEEASANAPFALAAYPAYSFHPVLSDSAANLALAPLMYEGLFTLDSAFQPQPLLCQSCQVSGDGLTWTFTLQPGITFSDGTPLTGEIAAQALQTARWEGSRYAERLSCVTAVQGSGDQVTVTLSRPNGALPALLDIPISLGEGERPLGTGPYVLTDRGGTLSLAARPDWRQGTDSLPALEIPLSAMIRADELLPAFNSGEISLMDVDLTGENGPGTSGRYQVWDYNTTQLLYVGFNARQGLCRDGEVRQAIARAIDRETVVDSIFARHGAPAALPFHPDSPWYDQTAAGGLSFDPALLAGLGLEGRPLSLVVNIESTATSAVATYVAGVLESAGLVVSVDRLPWAEYQETVARGDFDLYIGQVYLTPDFDLNALLGAEGALNYGGWTSGASGSLLSVYSAARGDARTAAAAALSRHLSQQVPIAPICFQNGTLLTQYGRVEGLTPVYGNIFSQLDGWTIQE